MKRILTALTALSAIPSALATSPADQGMNIVSMLFGTVSTGEEALVKVALFVLVLIAVYSGAATAFSAGGGGGKASAVTVSIIVAWIATRFMPQEWVLSLGSIITALVFFIVPYFLISKLMGGWGRVRWIVLIATYIGLALLIFGGSSLFIQTGSAYEVLDDLAWYLWYSWAGGMPSWIIGGVLVLAQTGVIIFIRRFPLLAQIPLVGGMLFLFNELWSSLGKESYLGNIIMIVVGLVFLVSMALRLMPQRPANPQ